MMYCKLKKKKTQSGKLLVIDRPTKKSLKKRKAKVPIYAQ